MASKLRRATYSVSDAAKLLGVDYEDLATEIRTTGMVTSRVRVIEIGQGRYRVPAAALDRELGFVDDEESTR